MDPYIPVAKHRGILAGGLCAFAIVATLLFYVYQLHHSSLGKCDDTAYRSLAAFYADGTAIPEDVLQVRTYGYAAALAPLVKLSHVQPISLSELIMIVQLATYLGASFLLYRVVETRYSARVSMFVLAGLLLNVFVLPYLGISLTDGPSLTIALVAAALILILLDDARQARVERLFLLALGLGLLVGYGVMVRPGNVSWVPACAVALLMVWLRRKPVRFSTLAALVVAGSAGFFLAVLPQLLVNTVMFHRHTVFPVFDLGGFQVASGVKLLKYGTHVGERPTPMPYLNPWYRATDPANPTLAWYGHRPWDGVRTLYFHLFGVLDFDYLFCYVHGGSPWYRPLLFLLSQTAVFWGAVGYGWWGRRARQFGMLSAVGAGWVLVGTYGVSWAGVYATAAVENRFALPMMAILLPLGLWAVREALRERRTIILGGTLFLVYLVAAGACSHFLGTVKTGG